MAAAAGITTKGQARRAMVMEVARKRAMASPEASSGSAAAMRPCRNAAVASRTNRGPPTVHAPSEARR